MQDYQQPLQQPINNSNGGNQNQFNPVMQNPQFTPYVQQQPLNYQDSNQPQPIHQNYQSNPIPQQPTNYQYDGNQVQSSNPLGNQYPNPQQPAIYQNDGNQVQYSNPQQPNNQTAGQQIIDPNTVPVQQPISVSTGSPESAPIPVAPEQSNQSVEYGYEKLKQIEKASENLQQIENKETRNPQNDDQQLEKHQIPVTQLPPAKTEGPKIFGYHIPQSITTNINAIRERKGTGDPREATTWIYVLLDKLLKRQTYQD